MRKNSWWSKARKAMNETADLGLSFVPAWIHFHAADDAFEKANIWRTIKKPGARAQAKRYHRIGVKEFLAGEQMEATIKATSRNVT